jgi:rhomboid family protein
VFIPLRDDNSLKSIPFQYVTVSLIALNVIVYLLEAGGLDRSAIAGFGVTPSELFGTTLLISPGPGTTQAIPFAPGATLVTYMFFHADIFHLVGNMLFLWVFGDNVEDAMGHLKFLTFFFACAAAAAFTHILFNSTSTAPLVGASGAISGIIGAYLVLYPRVRVYMLVRIVIPLPIPIPALWALGAWIGVQLFNALVPTMEPVAWWAHLGGVATGALLVGLFKRPEVELFGRPRP